MLQMAWRNLFRNRKRTIVTVISVIFAVAIVAFFRFLQAGSYREMMLGSVGNHTGFIQITANGWVEQKELERYLEIDPARLEGIKEVEGVTGISPRIEAAGLAGYKKSSKFTRIFCADYKAEEQITRLHRQPLEGHFPENRPDNYTIEESTGARIWPAVIGQRFARSMGVPMGGVLSLVSGQYDGSVGALLVRVVGIINPLDPALSGDTVFLSLEAGSRLFGLFTTDEGNVRYTNVAVGVDRVNRVDEVHEKLAAVFKSVEPVTEKDGSSHPDWQNYDPVALHWRELIPEIIQMIEMDKVSAEFTYAFLILVMAFGLLNTVQMSIHERTREMGILIALGTRARWLYRLVMLEALLLFLPGILLGCLIAMAGGAWLDANPIRLSGELAQASRDMGFEPVYTATVSLRQLAVSLSTIVLPSMGLIALAARRIYKLRVLEAIQSL